MFLLSMRAFVIPVQRAIVSPSVTRCCFSTAGLLENTRFAVAGSSRPHHKTPSAIQTGAASAGRHEGDENTVEDLAELLLAALAAAPEDKKHKIITTHNRVLKQYFELAKDSEKKDEVIEKKDEVIEKKDEVIKRMSVEADLFKNKYTQANAKKLESLGLLSARGVIEYIEDETRPDMITMTRDDKPTRKSLWQYIFKSTREGQQAYARICKTHKPYKNEASAAGTMAAIYAKLSEEVHFKMTPEECANRGEQIVLAEAHMSKSQIRHMEIICDEWLFPYRIVQSKQRGALSYEDDEDSTQEQ